MATRGGAVRAGAAFVELFADDSALVSGLRRAQNRLNAFGHDLTSLGLKTGAVGTALAAPFVLAARTFAKTGDELSAMSTRTGFAIETLSALELATNLTDTSMVAFENAIKRAQRTMIAMVLGTKETSKALRFLGLAAQDIRNLNPEDQFRLIADRLSMIENSTARAGAAMAIFGREATHIITMLTEGSKGLDEYRRKSDELGLTLSRDVIARGDLLNDTLSIIRLQIDRVAIAVGDALSPALQSLGRHLVRILKGVIDWVKKTPQVINQAAKFTIVTIALGGALIVLGTAISSIAVAGGIAIGTLAAMSFIASQLLAVISFILTPLGLLVTGLAAAGTAFVILNGQAKAVTSFIMKQFSMVGGVVVETIRGIAASLMSGDIERAGRILFAGLRVVFLEGSSEIRKIWDNLGTHLIDAMKSVGTKMVDNFVDNVKGLGRAVAEAAAESVKNARAEVTDREATDITTDPSTRNEEFEKKISEARQAQKEDLKIAQARAKWEVETFDRLLAKSKPGAVGKARQKQLFGLVQAFGGKGEFGREGAIPMSEARAFQKTYLKKMAAILGINQNELPKIPDIPKAVLDVNTRNNPMTRVFESLLKKKPDLDEAGQARLMDLLTQREELRFPGKRPKSEVANIRRILESEIARLLQVKPSEISATSGRPPSKSADERGPLESASDFEMKMAQRNLQGLIDEAKKSLEAQGEGGEIWDIFRQVRDAAAAFQSAVGGEGGGGGSGGPVIGTFIAPELQSILSPIELSNRIQQQMLDELTELRRDIRNGGVAFTRR